MSQLEFEHVSYQYPGEDFDIIDDLSFSVEPGSFHCIIGVSGCGKSTIFRMTNGLPQPKSGTIRVGGRPIGEQKHYCGYMPQKDLLFPWRTIGENLALPLEIMGGLSRQPSRPTSARASSIRSRRSARDSPPMISRGRARFSPMVRQGNSRSRCGI